MNRLPGCGKNIPSTGRSCVPENLLELCRCGLGSFGPLLAGVKTVVIPEDAVRNPGRPFRSTERKVTRFVCVHRCSMRCCKQRVIGKAIAATEVLVSSGEPLTGNWCGVFTKLARQHPDQLIWIVGGSADATCFDTSHLPSSEAVRLAGQSPIRKLHFGQPVAAGAKRQPGNCVLAAPASPAAIGMHRRRPNVSLFPSFGGRRKDISDR